MECLCGVVWNASSYPRGGATVLAVAKNIKTVSKCRSPLSDAVYCGLSLLKMPPKKPIVAKATGKASTKLAPGKGAVKKSTKTTVAGSGTTGGRQHEMRPKSMANNIRRPCVVVVVDVEVPMAMAIRITL